MATTLPIAPRKIVATATANATLAKGAHTPVDATAAARTMTLPTDAAAGVVISVEKTDASANAVTVSGTFRGTASTLPLTSQYEARTFLSEGAGSWRPTSDHRTTAALAAKYAYRRNTPLVVAALGDSQTANENATPDFTTAGATTNASWLLIGCIQSGERLAYGGNFGVPGETSSAILLRVGDVIAAAPDVCVVTAGRNDGAATATTANVDTICQTLLAAGITPVVGTVPPDNTTTDTALMLRIRATNAQIRKLARTRGYALVDFFSALVDPTSGGYKSGQYKDTTHPNTLGLAPMATAFVNAVAPGSGTGVYRRAENTLFGGEVVTNGLMSGGTAGTPTGWSQLSATGGTPALITNDSRFANSTCWELSVASGATPNYLMQQVDGVTVGETYEVSFRLAVQGLPYGGGYPSLDLERGNAVLFHRFRFQADVVGTLTYRFVADHNTMRLNWRWQNGTMAANASLRLGEMSMRSLTALGAA